MKRIYYDANTGQWLLVKDVQGETVESIKYVDVEDAELTDVILFHIDDEKLVVDQKESSKDTL